LVLPATPDVLGQGEVPHRLALAFDCQIVERVPVSVSDVRLDAVISPFSEYSR
jgi:5-formyltetrahydrofolate cyclo-ligase